MIHFVDNDNIGCSVKLSKSFFSVFYKNELCTYGYQATIYEILFLCCETAAVLSSLLHIHRNNIGWEGDFLSSVVNFRVASESEAFRM